MPRERTRKSSSVPKARQLRKSLSLPEILLWQELRRKAFRYRFRRQHRIDPYVLDFYCAKISLCVEVDSSWHDGRAEQDRRRDVFLGGLGVSILRVSAKDVLDSPVNTAIWVSNACDEVTCWKSSGEPKGYESKQFVRYPEPPPA